MNVTLLAFAQARELLGFQERAISVGAEATPASILQELCPEAKTIIATGRVAIDLEYGEWSQGLREGQTVAFIPPVSGG